MPDSRRIPWAALDPHLRFTPDCTPPPALERLLKIEARANIERSVQIAANYLGLSDWLPQEIRRVFGRAAGLRVVGADMERCPDGLAIPGLVGTWKCIPTAWGVVLGGWDPARERGVAYTMAAPLLFADGGRVAGAAIFDETRWREIADTLRDGMDPHQRRRNIDAARKSVENWRGDVRELAYATEHDLTTAQRAARAVRRDGRLIREERVAAERQLEAQIEHRYQLAIEDAESAAASTPAPA